MSNDSSSIIQVVNSDNEAEIRERVRLRGAGGGGTGDSMDARVTRLETHMEYVRADLSEIKAGQKSTGSAIAVLTATADKLSSKIDGSELKLSSQMRDLPTKADLKNYNLQLMAIGIAILILVVTGIAGGFILVKHG